LIALKSAKAMYYNETMKKYVNCFKLNLRMLGHVATGRWMTQDDIAAGYDRLAEAYNHNWLVNLQPVTNRLLAALPKQVNGKILDLGCGTGYTTAALEKAYPKAKITGVDVSGGMLAEAAKICHHAQLHQDDMLHYITTQPSASIELVLAAWSMGYSQPNQIIAQAERVLKPGGMLAFVVNLADSLRPVFYAYRRCMAAFPGKVNKAIWPHFPDCRDDLEKRLKRHSFTVSVLEESQIVIFPPGEQENLLPWLMKTGILAGFDQVLPLEDPEIARHFELQMATSDCKTLSHHYVMIKSVRQ